MNRIHCLLSAFHCRYVSTPPSLLTTTRLLLSHPPASQPRETHKVQITRRLYSAGHRPRWSSKLVDISTRGLQHDRWTPTTKIKEGIRLLVSHLGLVVHFVLLLVILIGDLLESVHNADRHTSHNAVLPLLPLLPLLLLRLADITDIGVLHNLLVSACRWLHRTWGCEVVLRNRLIHTVAESREWDKVAGLPESGKLTAADGAGEVGGIAHYEDWYVV